MRDNEEKIEQLFDETMEFSDSKLDNLKVTVWRDSNKIATLYRVRLVNGTDDVQLEYVTVNESEAMDKARKLVGALGGFIIY